MDFGLAFSYVFQDQDWIKKVAIAGALMIVPFLGWLVVLGWSIEITRRVIAGEEPVLPDWADFGDFLMKGLKGFVVGVVLAIPLILITVPYSVTAALLDPDDMEVVIYILSICFSCFSLIYGVILAFALPAAYGQLAATDQIAESVNPGKLMALVRANPSAYIIAVLGVIVAGIVSQFGVILCVIGYFFTLAYSLSIQGHLYGQAYKEASANLPV
jgi:hypothetical protein